MEQVLHTPKDISDKLDNESELCCHVCSSQDLKLISGFELLPRVASDRSLWPKGGKLAICENCGCTQTPTDYEWHAQAAQIYKQYEVEQPSTGQEQFVFGVGNPAPRSAKMLERTAKYWQKIERGRLLDFGCGNGGLLRSFAQLDSTWSMVGFELNEKYRSQIESIPGVKQFCSDSLDSISGQFDLITMCHVLEHLSDPVARLKELKKYIAPGGYVLIQVPDVTQNPFFLLIADHCSHFTKATLTQVVVMAGYKPVEVSDNWISRELSVLATPNTEVNGETEWHCDTDFSPESAVRWLENTTRTLKDLAQKGPLGIFGSSIAASWLYSVLEGNVSFFVDEDPNKAQQQHLGKPIITPADVPPGSNVFIGLAPKEATSVAQRLAEFNFISHIPSSLV